MAQERRAVVVGIDDYLDPEGILSDLDGAVNDARDLAGTFRAIGMTDITVLLDGEARRPAILTAWRDALERSEAGDTLFLTYAGHGMQRVAGADSDEDDDHDEFLALHGFEREGPGRSDFVLDDEIDAFVRRAAERDVQVVLVIDACHSGTAFRSVDRRVKPRYRFSGVKIEGDLFAEGETDDLFAGLDQPQEQELATAIPDNLASFAAVLDDQLVPEIPLPDADGRAVPRGAMSYFFSRGLRGAADVDGDGRISFLEMKRYVVRNINFETQGAQIPNVVDAEDGQERVLFAHSRATVVSPPPDREILIAVIGGGEAGPPDLEGARVVELSGTPDIVWDAGRAEVVSGIDTIVARDISADRLQGVVDKVRARSRLSAMAETHSLDITVKPEKPIYSKGEVVEISIRDIGHPYLTLVNLANDGTVQFLYPLSPEEAQPHDVAVPMELGGVDVSGPFGADLLIALATDQPPSRLVAELEALDGRVAPLEVPGTFRKWLSGVPYRMGLLSFDCCDGEGVPC
ncbi:caspase family protein [Thalassobaculum salexigens]|uniref:caspase family protein n=1 Tax=Thalassobaculum salexigens TaxID=455360 RepID=UPI00248E03BA|nr:caspase family protein [Thalassobaculum salexigens]